MARKTTHFMPGQGTRLDRLIELLDSTRTHRLPPGYRRAARETFPSAGTTLATRIAAAQQIGEVNKQHPHELPVLINKVRSCSSRRGFRSFQPSQRVNLRIAVTALLAEQVLGHPHRCRPCV